MKNEPHWVKIMSPSYTRTAVPDLQAFRLNYCPLIASEYIQLRAHAEVDLGLRIHVRLKCNFDHSLGAFSRRDLKMFFSFFPENIVLTFHADCLLTWNGKCRGVRKYQFVICWICPESGFSVILLLCMLVNNFSRHFEICFPFFAKNRFWHFMQIVCLWDNLH